MGRPARRRSGLCAVLRGELAGGAVAAAPRWLVGSFGACALTQQQQVNPSNVTALIAAASFAGTTLHTCATAESLVKAH